MNISFSRRGVGRVSLQLPTDLHGKIEPFKQQQVPAAVVDRFQGKWEHYVEIARLFWSKLTEEQLVRSQGRKDMLSALIQRRYVMAPPAADAQVEKLMQKCGF
jgi:hypothetical protein